MLLSIAFSKNNGVVKVSIRNVNAHMLRENLNDLGNSEVKENRYNLGKEKQL